MIRLLKYLDEQSNYTSFLSAKGFFFEFDEFSIVTTLKINSTTREQEDEFLDYYDTVGSDIDLQNLPYIYSDCSIDKLFFTDYEYLGNRKSQGVPEYSVCFNMYNLLSSIYKFQNNLNQINYHLDLNFGYDDDFTGFCEGEENYIFKIFVPISEIESLLPNVLSDYKRSDNKKLEMYNECFLKNTSLDITGDISILTTNTKSRRLGYLKLLDDFFKHEKKVTANKINQKFEKFVSKSNIIDDLSHYRNSKGDIKITKTGISAKPYVDLALDLNFVKKVNQILSTGKKNKVYQVIRQEYFPDDDGNNIFSLNTFDKLFFLEEILKQDYLYTFLLIELIYVSKETSFNRLKKIFQKQLIIRLDEYSQKFNLSDKAKRSCIAIRNRVNGWKSAEVYLEHVLMPRINWLDDLELVIQEKDTIRLSPKGNRLFQSICIWNDIEGGRIIDPMEYINTFFQKVFSFIYQTNNVTVSNNHQLHYLIDDYLNTSFEKFKTLAPNRTTLSQAVSYVKYKLIYENNIVIDYNYIEDYIKNFAKDKYIYKFQSQYKDGYIQKK